MDFTQNGHGSPHLLHVLQVDVIVWLVVMFILGLAVVGMVLVVVVTVALAKGNGTHKFTGLFALGGANLLTSSFLTGISPSSACSLWTSSKRGFFL